MNKNLIIGIVVVVLLLLGLGFFFITRNSTLVSTSSETTTEESQESTGVMSQKQSLRSLLGLGTSQICEFSDNASGSSGKVYVSSGKMRGDFATVVNGEVTSSHMYSDGQTMYIWMEGSEMGYKNSIASAETPAVNPTGTQTSANFDINQQVDYKCQSWTADESMFILPSGVEFKDLSTLMVVPTSGSKVDQGDKCSACNALSGEAKTQCLTALGCN
jgi:hypothetical protein